MPATSPADPQTALRDTAQEFIRLRGTLQQAETLPVVKASPTTKARLDALNKRAGAIQSAVENVGKMVDGARRWFSDAFGVSIEQNVPLASPAIDTTVQTSIATMKFFMRDAREELNRIIARQKEIEALPKEQQPQALSALATADGEAIAAMKPIGRLLKNKWVLIGVGAVAVFILWKDLWKGNWDHGK